MKDGTWLRDHEALAALIFTALSLALIGAFAWVERRFLQREPRRQDTCPQHSLLYRIAFALIAAFARAERRFLQTESPPEETGPDDWLVRREHRKRS